jgi:hypothetical protein
VIDNNPPYPNADYYDVGDHDRLEHETVGDALEAYLDAEAKANEDVRAEIERLAPIEVTAHELLQVGDGWIESAARSLLESAAEAFSETFGDPDGDGEDGLDDEMLDEHVPAMVEMLRRFFACGTVWRCDPLGTFELDAAAVEALMREARPDWFPATGAAP